MDAAHSLVGRKLGAYRIESRLGEGAMGEVFRAVHEALGRQVALKTLKPQVAADQSLLERFFAEARAVNIIRHENIVECTDMVNDPTGQSYIVMELLEGQTLGQAIRDAGRLPPRRAVRIAAQIADAIAAAHDKGIVHRDLKPDNVFLIQRAGLADYVKVLDFGIARLRPELGVTATQSGALVGTPAYMSPEQVKGDKAGPSSDVYALGVVLFHMLTGRLPFAAPSVALMLIAQLNETPARVDGVAADVPRPLADLIARVLAKDPAQRPASMAELRVALLESVGLPTTMTSSLLTPVGPTRKSAIAMDETLASDQSVPKTTVPTPTKRPTWWWISGGVLAVAAVAAVALTWSRGGGKGAAAPGPADAASVAPVTLRDPVPNPDPVPEPTGAETPDASIVATTPAADAGITAKRRPPKKTAAAKEPAKEPVKEPVKEPPKEPVKEEPPKDVRDPTKKLVPPKDQ